MKKLFNILFTLILCFTLVGCQVADESKDEKVTINYETDGGTEINSTEVDKTNASSYTLPQNPTKEGYIFDGWYIDKDCTQAFDALAALDDKIITLYAKWIEDFHGLSFTTSFDFSVKLDITPVETTDDTETSDETTNDSETTDETEEEPLITFDKQHIDMSGVVNVSASIEETEIEKLEDLKAAFTLNVKFTDNSTTVNEDISSAISQLTASPIAFNVYIKDGYAYVTVGLVSYKVNLVKLLAEAKEEAKKYEEQLGIEETDEDMTLSKDEMIAKAKEDAQAIIDTLVNKYGFSEELILKFVNTLKSLIPEEKVEDGVTSYSITQEDFEKDVDTIANFIYENLNQFVKEVANANTYAPEDEYTDHNGNVFSTEKMGWTDADGVFHSFKDKEEAIKYGEFNELTNTYHNYYLNAYYDLTTWELVTEQEYHARFVGKEVTDANGNKFTYGSNTYVDSEGVTHSLLTDIETLESNNIGYYDEKTNLFTVYTTGESFDITTGEKKNYSDVVAQQVATEIAEFVKEHADEFKKAVTINALKFSYSDSKVNLNVDVDYDGTAFEKYVESNVTFSAVINLDVTYKNEDITITYPDFSTAIDVTDGLKK